MKFLWGIIVLALLGLGGLGAAAWTLGYFQPVGGATTFTVQKGENFSHVAGRLEAEGVVRSSRAFRWYVNLLSSRKKLQRGEFALFRGMPVPEVVQALTDGKPIEYKFTVLEGENLYQIAENLEAKGLAKRADFLAAVKSPEVLHALPIGSRELLPFNAEGYLFPDTYLLQKVFSAKEIALIMVQHFKEVYRGLEAEVRASPVLKELRLDPHQFVILASIVEKETGAAVERPQIASVFVNRLRKRMRLQTDPTIIYGIYVAKGSWNGNITRSDLDGNSPYNSYQHEGLPPGPISNPGLNALKAAIHPAETEFLYFVSRGDGTSIFSKDLSSHSKAVKQTQFGSKDGKSWRNLDPSQRAK